MASLINYEALLVILLSAGMSCSIIRAKLPGLVLQSGRNTLNHYWFPCREVTSYDVFACFFH